MLDAPIHGWNEPCFDCVRAAFERNFAEHGDIGAAGGGGAIDSIHVLAPETIAQAT